MDVAVTHLDAGSPTGSLVWTALMYAAAIGDVGLVEAQLTSDKNNNNNNIVHDTGSTKQGYSALHVAVKFDQIEVAQRLLAHGANIDAVDEHGVTCLHVAATLGNMRMVQLLLEANAKQLPSAVGTLPHECASAQGHAAIAALLAPTDVQGSTQPGVEPNDNQVHMWLRAIGLEMYISLFDAAGYDDLGFIKDHGLSMEDLAAIGISKRGHLAKLSGLYQLDDVLPASSSEDESDTSSNDDASNVSDSDDEVSGSDSDE
ncbi:hypothetical protein SPRG_12344 [Saprolegnia parasitica CBS 223.65]|uniref:SAM domain-containing protein n=1 Tax=Saprolegnia parasitica (strain CBS 223.65) TaxID=695850 RepID=A0A067BUA0_SAPPC|nr:hypothetical protein SPRG_12344 [Saprolegnia parasitica CBS 223.65]KDO21843.1 hypothetical protein SPRG_12344 [Saprolegnia parasitica CBS 223.65]|eukprot:XP_012207401.1 hypothetical protein SPRG_12344 [Saprolegnia parasitica CBS 223.65]